jgi:hypothetical protein
MRFRPGAWLCMVAIASFTGAQAGSPMPVEMKCPVGGKKFTYISTASMSQWGSRPDGKPYGSWTFPMPLAVCPDNGLAMYRNFSKPEIKTLKGLLATPEYQQLRSADTPYYLAYWLMDRLGDPLDQRLWVLQQASWESDMNPVRKRRYQEEFVQRARGYSRPEPPQDDLGWIATQLRAANALRELEKFDEALQLLDSTPRESLDVAVPGEKVSGTTPSGLGKTVENYGEIQAARTRRSWLHYAEALRAVIVRHDPSSEPIDMVPVRVAAQMCVSQPSSAAEYTQVCHSEAIKQQLEKAEKIRSLLNSPPPPPPPPAEHGTAR